VTSRGSHIVSPFRAIRIVAVVIAAIATAAGCAPLRPSPSVPRASSSSSAPSASASPTGAIAGPSASVDRADAGWTLAGAGDLQDAVQFSAIVAVPDGFVMTGSRGGAGQVPVALHSVDGTTWTSEPIEGRFGGPSGLLAWGDRVLGIGAGEGSPECAHPFAMDAWVRSAAGTWTQAPFDPVFCDNGGTVVAQGARVWLAGAVRDIPSLMETADGLRWTSRSDRLAGLYPRAAAVDGRGLWVFASDLAGGSVALSTPDGRSFERRPVTTGGGQPVDVLAAPVLDGEVRLIVTSGDAVGVLRSLADGSWQEDRSSGLPARGIAAILAVGGQLVALGSDDEGLPLAFTAADGTAWAPIPLPQEAGAGTTLNGLAVRGGVAVLVGQVASPAGSGAVGAVWTASAAILGP
jgi:hypothetical protein